MIINRSKNWMKGIRSMFSSHNKKSFNLTTIKPPNLADGDHMTEEAIVVHNLMKHYSNGKFLAVDQLSFAVGKEQFFGLLGINGAGKTTTFRMLTGDLSVTFGNAYINSNDLLNDRVKYVSQIGYCVDPVARRKMWVAISDIQYNSGSSIILSSHSMDECEALCDRIAIMAAGQFKCIGSTQYLRTKFGQGYSLIIKLKPDLVAQNEDYLDDVQVYIEERLTSAQLKDIHQTYMCIPVYSASKFCFLVIEVQQYVSSMSMFSMLRTALE